VTLSHLDTTGRPRMVDVAHKDVTQRVAVAEGTIRLSRDTLAEIARSAGPKGDVLTTAELAGVMGAKRTAELIPLCHPLPLDSVIVEASLEQDPPGVRVRATARATARTGVEMEALTAVTVALLTVYDMAKAMDRAMELGDIHLLAKAGGQSGDWLRPE
jgi:cyclic pyranopterin monophosphate synthase